MNQISSIAHSKILISPLDWGLGHLTRTLVLIKKLQKQKNEITFAGNKFQIDFIKKELPNLNTVFINGYNIRLSSKKNTYLQILNQVFTILNSIRKERKWLKGYLKTNPFNYIISDNRYGMYHNETASILLTHQISLQIPLGKKIINTVLKKRIEKFNTCWIPDWKTRELSGNLSNNTLAIPMYFIGPLSRFNIKKSNLFKYQYLFIISGPEPEKSHFTNQVTDFITKHKLNAILVVPNRVNQIGKQSIIENPNTTELELLINQSKTIVSKSGYTTVMDLIPSGKQVFLIPTKGQYEQEYLHQLHQSRNSYDKILAQFTK